MIEVFVVFHSEIISYMILLEIVYKKKFYKNDYKKF